MSSCAYLEDQILPRSVLRSDLKTVVPGFVIRAFLHPFVFFVVYLDMPKAMHYHGFGPWSV